MISVNKGKVVNNAVNLQDRQSNQEASRERQVFRLWQKTYLKA